MGAVEISFVGLLLGFLLLVIPLAISHWFKLGMGKTTLWSIGRMSVQLALVGVFLEYIFALNNMWLNFAWLMLMIITAIFSAVSRAKLKFRNIFGPISIAFTISTLLILFYFNAFVIQLNYLFEARYLIALGGMLLGNVLSVNITAVNSFYQEIRSQNKFFLYRLAMGANQREALEPFLRRSFQLALLPALAKTATIGVVSLPGMMTGQILGGSSPATAIRYQIAIMIAIYTCGALSVLLTLLLSTKESFNGYGVLKENIFSK
jgi:putative ABC transport system permease protein